MRRKLLCALCVISFVCNAQIRKMPKEFDDWVNSKGMKHATVALEISQLSSSPAQSPTVLYSFDNERAMQPASIMKLVTTAAALSILGPELRVKTEVGFSGQIVNGALEGDLIIKGYGNAMLASSKSNFPKGEFANSVVNALRKEGIKSIKGNIIGDGSILTESPISTEWTWEDMGNQYASGISGLNYEDNMYEIVLDTSKPGQRPSLKSIEPHVDNLVIENQLMSKNYSSDSAYVYGAPYQDTRLLLGAVPHKNPTFRVKGDVPDPAQFTASRIKTELIKNGIEVEGEALSHRTIKVPQTNKIIYTHNSENLSFVVKQTNLYSVNLFAEMLLRQIALTKGNGSEIEGINAIYAFLKSLKIDTEGIKIYDGCGLAPADRVTAHFMVTLLSKMYQNKDFYNSLPVAGKTGTIRTFLKNTKLEGKARLKTGTTKNVISYSGYIESDDGKTYVVSIIVNNHTCHSAIVRKNIEKMLLLLIHS